MAGALDDNKSGGNYWFSLCRFLAGCHNASFIWNWHAPKALGLLRASHLMIINGSQCSDGNVIERLSSLSLSLFWIHSNGRQFYIYFDFYLIYYVCVHSNWNCAKPHKYHGSVPFAACFVSKNHNETVWNLHTFDVYYFSSLSAPSGVMTTSIPKFEPFRNDSRIWHLTLRLQIAIVHKQVAPHLNADTKMNSLFYVLRRENSKCDNLKNIGTTLSCYRTAGFKAVNFVLEINKWNIENENNRWHWPRFIC